MDELAAIGSDHEDVIVLFCIWQVAERRVRVGWVEEKKLSQFGIVHNGVQIIGGNVSRQAYCENDVVEDTQRGKLRLDDTAVDLRHHVIGIDSGILEHGS